MLFGRVCKSWQKLAEDCSLFPELRLHRFSRTIDNAQLAALGARFKQTRVAHLDLCRRVRPLAYCACSLPGKLARMQAVAGTKEFLSKCKMLEEISLVGGAFQGKK